jgi:hypothetical protein
VRDRAQPCAERERTFEVGELSEPPDNLSHRALGGIQGTGEVSWITSVRKPASVLTLFHW